MGNNHSAYMGGGVWYSGVWYMSMTHKATKDKAGKVTGVVLTIVFDPNPKPSASGKTLIDYSTRGNKSLDVDGVEVTVGLNIYHYP